MELKDYPTGKTAFYGFDAQGEPRAVILLVHGLGEHAGRYADWAARFNEKGVSVRAFDLPGHGRTPGRWGVIGSPGKVYDNIDAMLGEISTQLPAVPVFLYGHSLGGGIVLNYLISRRPSLTGAIVTSPWIILSETPPAYKIILAKVAGSLFPGMTQPSGLNAANLSRDQEVVEAYRNDPLVHGQISAGLYLWMTTAAAETLSRAGEISVPLLLAHGRNDMITSSSGSVQVAGIAPQSTLKLWDEGYHELHNDLQKDEHFDFITEWMDTLI